MKTDYLQILIDTCYACLSLLAVALTAALLICFYKAITASFEEDDDIEVDPVTGLPITDQSTTPMPPTQPPAHGPDGGSDESED